MDRQLVPDILSLVRLMLSAPLFVLLYVSDCHGIHATASAFLIILMLATDRLDGTLARRWGCAGASGTYLDISADMAMALSSSLALSLNGTVSALLPALMAAFAVQFPLTSRIVKNDQGLPYDRLGTFAGMSCMVFPLVILMSENIVVEGLTGCLQAAMAVLCAAAIANRLRICLGSR